MEDRDMILVSLVKQYPHLYDRSMCNFKDKIIVENSWKTIATSLKTTVDDCQRRWYVLRNRYAKERRECDSIIDPLKRQWPLMKYMSFLEVHVKRRRSFRAMNGLNFNQHQDQYYEDQPIIPIATTKSSKWDEILTNDNNKKDDQHSEDLEQKYHIISDQSNQSSYYDDDDRLKSPPPQQQIQQQQQHHHKLNDQVTIIKSTSSSTSDSAFNETIDSSCKTNAVKNEFDNTNRTENDSNMHFCLSLHTPLQKIPKHLLTRAKIEILQVLDKYENYENYS